MHRSFLFAVQILTPLCVAVCFNLPFAQGQASERSCVAVFSGRNDTSATVAQLLAPAQLNIDSSQAMNELIAVLIRHPGQAIALFKALEVGRLEDGRVMSFSQLRFGLKALAESQPELYAHAMLSLYSAESGTLRLVARSGASTSDRREPGIQLISSLPNLLWLDVSVLAKSRWIETVAAREDLHDRFVSDLNVARSIGRLTGELGAAQVQPRGDALSRLVADWIMKRMPVLRADAEHFGVSRPDNDFDWVTARNLAFMMEEYYANLRDPDMQHQFSVIGKELDEIGEQSGSHRRLNFLLPPPLRTPGR